MINISEAFKDHKAFIPFITGGDPDLETTKKTLLALQEAGADLIEIGIPFSDPMAEGPVIQDADERALAGGCTTDLLMDAIKEVAPSMHVPMVFMTYMNPVYTYGKEKFMERCREIGISGVIIPDVPFEERDELSDVCKKYDIAQISMVAPTSEERITTIAKESKGFLYCVSSLGVTGVRNEITSDVGAMVNKAHEASDIPCCIGFGISNPEQAAKMAAVSDGVISGSAIVRIIGEHGKDCVEPVRAFVKSMADAVHAQA
ncbi:tryptophan synthase, alpha chain [Lachnospiraceae bacterium]|nr:tryptophan synthase, alpha chain [Lachnospiraceae bacterium]